MEQNSNDMIGIQLKNENNYDSVQLLEGKTTEGDLFDHFRSSGTKDKGSCYVDDDEEGDMGMDSESFQDINHTTEDSKLNKKITYDNSEQQTNLND